MARSTSSDPAAAAKTVKKKQDGDKKQGRIAQLRAVFTMTRSVDPAVLWWMLLAFAGTVVVGVGIGFLIGQPIYLGILSVPLGVMVALVVMARRAERAAFAQIAGQPGAAGAALQNLRRGWAVEQEPVAADPRTRDLVFRAVGRPGVVLLTEGPLPRVTKLADGERKRIQRVLGAGVPVTVLHAGDGDDQIPLIKVSRTIGKMRPALTKEQVIEVSKRLRALGGVRMPVPKGVDPMRARPDRKASRGR